MSHMQFFLGQAGVSARVAQSALVTAAVVDRSSTRDLTTQSSYFPKQKHAGSSSPAHIAGASDALPGEVQQTGLHSVRVAVLLTKSR